MNYRRICILAVAIISTYHAPVRAESVYSANVRVELISDGLTVIPGEDFWVGLKMTMDEGWHTYWRNSGDSGMATHIEWKLPEGFEAGEIHWPYPKRFDYTEDLAGYGYDGEVVLYSKITTSGQLKTAQKKRLRAKVNWLSCETICVPGTANLSIVVIAGKRKAVLNRSVHQRFVEEKKRWPMVLDSWRVSAINELETIKFNILSGDRGVYDITKLAFFPYRNDIIDHAAVQVFRVGNNGYELSVTKSELFDEGTQKIEGVLVAAEGWQSNGTEQGLYIDVPVSE